MTVRVIKTASHFVILFLLLVFQISSAQRSSFDLNDEGWRVVGDVQGFTTIPEYDSTGGNPGGHCYAVDVGTGDYWYWVAPDTFLGNKSAAFGKYLRFDLKQNKTTGQSNKADVIMEGDGIKIFYDTPYNPDLVWTHYDVLLDTAGWERNSYNSGQSVTVDDFQQVLANLTRLWIRGEYSVYVDIGSIDNVILEPIPSSVFSLSPVIQTMDIFPNPAADYFTLSLKGDPQKALLVEIFSSTGQKAINEILDFQSGMTTKNYSCRDWPAGVYRVRVSDAVGGVFRKIVIQ